MQSIEIILGLRLRSRDYVFQQYRCIVANCRNLSYLISIFDSNCNKSLNSIYIQPHMAKSTDNSITF